MLTSRKQDYEQKISRSLNMARLFYQNKDYTSAKEYVNDLLNMKPDSSDAHKLLSQINEALGEHELAIKNYRKSLELKNASNSLDNSFTNESIRLTPIKSNRSFINNSNHSTPNNQSMVSQNHVNYDVNISETVEKLLESKLPPLFAKLETSFKQNCDLSYTAIQKNCEEISVVKKKLLDVQKKVSLALAKVEEIATKSAEVPAPQIPLPPPVPQVTIKDIQTLNSTLNKLLDRFSFFSNDLNVKFDELSEKVNYLTYREQQDEENEDEEYDEDYTNHSMSFNHSGDKANLKPVELSHFIKKGGWTCSVCAVPNADSDLKCVSCETDNPNAPPAPASSSKPSFSFGFTNQNSLSQVSSSQTSQSGSQVSLKAPSINGGIASPIPSLFGPSAPQSTSAIPKSQPTIFGSGLSQPSFAAPPSGPSIFGQTPPSLFNAPTANQGFNLSHVHSPFSDVANLISQEPTNGVAVPSFSFNASPSQGPGTFKFANTPPSFSLGSRPTPPPPVSTSTSSLPSTTPQASTFSFTNLYNALSPKPTFGDSTNQKLDFSNTFNTKTSGSNLFNSLVTPSKADEKQESNESEQNKSFDGDRSEGSDLILPKVNLPENYEHITGEEEELELYSKRAKLYIYDNNEYKERGLGTLKILKNNKTGKIRVLMRRDTVLKVCLNAYITSLDKMSLKDDKFLSFQCLDFSDDKPNPGTYLLKLANVEALQEFQNTVKSLQANPNAVSSTSNQSKSEPKKAVSQPEKKQVEPQKVVDKDIEIVFVKEPTSAEHKKKVAELKLPINFFDYENKAPCKGCLGCKVDEVSWNELTCDKTDQPTTNGLGLFSNLATDVPQDKTDNIDTSNVGALATEGDVQSDFVSEKSKLLPVSYEHKTGEEEETAIYEQRAKLFRFDEKIQEYKERGVGSIKILKHHAKNQFRLLMRRDIVFKTICNHQIYPKLNLTLKSPNMCIWGTLDYSESAEGVKEIFLLKVKNEHIMKEFIDAVHKCISQLEQTKENN